MDFPSPPIRVQTIGFCRCPRLIAFPVSLFPLFFFIGSGLFPPPPLSVRGLHSFTESWTFISRACLGLYPFPHHETHPPSPACKSFPSHMGDRPISFRRRREKLSGVCFHLPVFSSFHLDHFFFFFFPSTSKILPSNPLSVRRFFSHGLKRPVLALCRRFSSSL